MLVESPSTEVLGLPVLVVWGGEDARHMVSVIGSVVVGVKAKPTPNVGVRKWCRVGYLVSALLMGCRRR